MCFKRTFSVGVVLLGMFASLNTTVAQSSSPAQKMAASTAQLKTVQMRITGMTCAACAKGLEASFRKMTGVEKVVVDYNGGEAIITFDPAKQSTDSLGKFIKSCGYQVKETRVV